MEENMKRIKRAVSNQREASGSRHQLRCNMKCNIVIGLIVICQIWAGAVVTAATALSFHLAAL